jgi:hypothetical protein
MGWAYGSGEGKGRPLVRTLARAKWWWHREYSSEVQQPSGLNEGSRGRNGALSCGGRRSTPYRPYSLGRGFESRPVGFF